MIGYTISGGKRWTPGVLLERSIAVDIAVESKERIGFQVVEKGKALIYLVFVGWVGGIRRGSRTISGEQEQNARDRKRAGF